MHLPAAQGTRVVTRRPLVDQDYKTHPAGSSGVVQEVLRGGAVLVCIAGAAGVPISVVTAHTLDLVELQLPVRLRARAPSGARGPASPRRRASCRSASQLPPGAGVVCLPLVVRVASGKHAPAHSMEGVVRDYDARSDSYTVQAEVGGDRVRVTVPACKVMAVGDEGAARAASASSDGSDEELSLSTSSTGSTGSTTPRVPSPPACRTKGAARARRGLAAAASALRMCTAAQDQAAAAHPRRTSLLRKDTTPGARRRVTFIETPPSSPPQEPCFELWDAMPVIEVA
eukprot:TRINITY_DN2319_c0_g2_i1.p1 TRINITY_DN2319_c0_g2~~TRINITY_DN2319_c0_g2_i1.p1  ORF type:complete len:286 (+),score=72.09 TRINITY_DN2319_c0_g2_i1:67-924(+)